MLNIQYKYDNYIHYTQTTHITLPQNESSHTDRFVMIGCTGGGHKDQHIRADVDYNDVTMSPFSFP